MTRRRAHHSPPLPTAVGGFTIPGRLPRLVACVLVGAATLGAACAEEPPDPPAAQTAADQSATLLTQRDELILGANRAYQARQYDEAMRQLDQLLPLYRQIYPVSEYPAGHLQIVETYHSMCTIAHAQKDFDRLMQLGAEGVQACLALYPNHDHRWTATCEVYFLNFQGVACFARNDLPAARQYFLQANDICRRHLDHDPAGAIHILLAKNYGSLAEIQMRMRDLHAADQSWSHAVTAFQYRLNLVYSLKDQRELAYYLSSRSRTLRLLGKYRSALELAQQSADLLLRVFVVSRAPEDDAAILQLVIDQGVLLHNLGNMEMACRVLDSARSRLERDVSYVALHQDQLDAVLSNLMVISDVRGSQSELEAYRDALRSRYSLLKHQAPSSRNPFDSAELLRNMGFVLCETGDYPFAERCYEEALALITGECPPSLRLPMDLKSIAVRHDRALLYAYTGRYEDAYAEYAEALRVAQQTFPVDQYPCGHPLLSGVMRNMATHCWLVGETDRAADLYHQVLVMDEALFPVSEYPDGHPVLQQAYSAWSEVLMQEKRFDEAKAYAEKAHAMILARMHVETDVRIYPRAHNDLANSLITLGRLNRAHGDYQAAHRLFGQALVSFESRCAEEDSEGQLSIALVLAELGRTSAAEGDYAAALERHRRSLAIRHRLFPQPQFPAGHPVLANALRDLGITCLDAGEPVEAFRLLAESVDMEHAIGESFFGGSSEAQLLNLAARKFQSLGPLVQAGNRAERAPEEVYPYVWRRHGFVPQLIADRQQALRELARETAPAAYEQYVTARRNLARVLLVSIGDNAKQNAAQLARIRQLTATKDDWEQQLTRGVESNRPGGQPVSDVQMLMRLLPERSVFVDFLSLSSRPFDATVPQRSNVGASDHIIAFVVGRNRPIEFVELGGPGEISALIAAWNDELSADCNGKAAIALRQKIWDPVSAHFADDVDTVYLAPDGVLAEVAWNALPSPAEAGVLLERYAIATVPHGRFLLDQLRQSNSGPAAHSPVLAVGDVDYGNPDGNASVAPQGLEQWKWPRLPGSCRELEAIVACGHGRELTVLTGANATTENVLQALATAGMAHLATHGFFLDEQTDTTLALAGAQSGSTRLTVNRTRSSVLGRSPLLRSGLALAGANARLPGDELGIPTAAHGILTAESIATLDGSRLQLVVLSACDTTRGDTAVGDGVLGMQNAFHMAGARNVIAGLWKVPDDSTAVLMSHFYQLLWGQHKTPLEALREAQLNMLRSTRFNEAPDRGLDLEHTTPLTGQPAPNRHAARPHVRDWAGFMLSGPGF